MGDPKKHRKKYSPPLHPWQGARIEEENKIFTEYGLKNKKEIWRINSSLRRFRSQAKHLIATRTDQARKEEKLLIDKLVGLGLLNNGQVARKCGHNKAWVSLLAIKPPNAGTANFRV